MGPYWPGVDSEGGDIGMSTDLEQHNLDNHEPISERARQSIEGGRKVDAESLGVERLRG